MTTFSRIDMSQLTRLTRAGRLREAMALLRDGGMAEPPRASSGPPEPDSHPTGPAMVLDMLKPRDADGAWSWPDLGTAGPGAAPDAPEAAQWTALRAALQDIGRPGAGSRATSSGRHRSAPDPLPEGARFEERTFRNGAGSRTYKLYVPHRQTDRPLPLVVMLHGCKQSPDDFAAGTRMNAIAEERGFLVAYPGQTSSANASRCWNWFNPGDQGRDAGEPSLIAGITRAVLRECGADPTRMYVAGLSAGGAAAAVMAAVYPDLYAAVGIHSGLACGAATDLPTAFSAMQGNGPVRAQGTRRIVPTIVFHGDADRTVHPVNADHIVAETQAETDLRRIVTRGRSPGGVTFTQTAYVDPAGRPMTEQWLLHGSGHAWSGGSRSGSYTDPRGPDASREMLRFFEAHAKRAG